MAKHPTSAQTRKHVITFLDLPDGTRLPLGEYEQVQEVHDDGSIDERTIASNRVTGDGRVWNTSYLADGAKTPVPLQVCNVCGKWARFTKRWAPALVTQKQSQRCARCHKTLCPAHAHRCWDGRYRCFWCAVWNWFWTLIRPVFCERR